MSVQSQNKEKAVSIVSASANYKDKTRFDRMTVVLSYIKSLPSAKCGLQAYAQISNILNEFEDTVFGKNEWQPPRSFQNGERTNRLYPIMAENFFEIPDYSGVMLLLAKQELLFVSRYGAIQIQKKDMKDKYGAHTAYSHRKKLILFDKLDFYGDDVWHNKNT